MQQEDRRYDVVVWGASGFTGRLVVENLHERYPCGGNLRRAVAGRNRARLEQLFDGMGGNATPPEIIVADSHDIDALGEMAKSTRVILTTVGPYAKYGSELVEACSQYGTHYCDLCGEAQWMRQMIDKHQALAQNSAARIVMSCGFDSIPSDMGVWFLQQQAIEKYGSPCSAVTLLVRAMKGGASGGTYASMLTAIKQARENREIARVLADPYSLNPEGERQGPDGGDQRGSKYNADASVWTAPFVMAAINTRVVRRSNALLDFAYGRDFRYHEATITGRGIGGRAKSILMSAGLGLFMIASAFEFTRKFVVQKLLPKPGEGPSRYERENGYFNFILVGRLPGGNVMRLRVKGDRDPGYGSTSKMLAESAICLALDELTVGGGFWTPSTAMGNPLLERLTANAGLSFELE
jgi:short subunit dehydrogenase-like uncharacterized protein